MQRPLEGLHILLVDDDAEIRELFGEELVFFGATVTLAADCQQALDAFLKDPALQLVMSDLRMPGGDGMSLLRKIKSHSGRKPLFVMMTGYSEMAPETAMAEGVDRIFEKPLDWDSLIPYLTELKRQLADVV